MKKQMMKMRKNILMLSFFLMVFSMQTVSAQNPDEFEPGVDDEPAAPIDGYIYAGLIAGALLAIRKLKKAELV